ncbi:hypothetical protein Tco_1515874 [Tanacetum coccineum]
MVMMHQPDMGYCLLRNQEYRVKDGQTKRFIQCQEEELHDDSYVISTTVASRSEPCKFSQCLSETHLATEADNSEAPNSSLDQRDPEADVVAHGPINDTAGDQEDIGPTS